MPNFFFGSNVFEKMLNLTMCWNFVAFFILNNKQTEKTQSQNTPAESEEEVFCFFLTYQRTVSSAALL